MHMRLACSVICSDKCVCCSNHGGRQLDGAPSVSTTKLQLLVGDSQQLHIFKALTLLYGSVSNHAILYITGTMIISSIMSSCQLHRRT